MRLRDYIVAKSPENARVGIGNPVISRIAARTGMSVHTIYAISIGRRHACAESAEKISKACDGHVKPREMMNHDKQKPGPKVGSRVRRARDQ